MYFPLCLHVRLIFLGGSKAQQKSVQDISGVLLRNRPRLGAGVRDYAWLLSILPSDLCADTCQQKLHSFYRRYCPIRLY